MRIQIPNWFVIATKPAQEYKAERNLKSQQFQVFLPLLWKRRPSKDDIRIPLFRGYLFLVIEDQWSAVSNTRGVGRILSNGEGEPAQIATEIIDGLRQQQERDGAVRLREVLPHQYTAGERIKLTGGPFQGFTATIESTNAAGRIALLLDTINSDRVIIARDDLTQIAVRKP